jgi:ketopantoate reductase
MAAGDGVLQLAVLGVMEEVLEIAALEGVDMPAHARETALAKARAFPFETRTSLQRDVQAGRRHDGDLFGGAILKLSDLHGNDIRHAVHPARLLPGSPMSDFGSREGVRGHPRHRPDRDA